MERILVIFLLYIFFPQEHAGTLNFLSCPNVSNHFNRLFHRLFHETMDIGSSKRRPNAGYAFDPSSAITAQSGRGGNFALGYTGGLARNEKSSVNQR